MANVAVVPTPDATRGTLIKAYIVLAPGTRHDTPGELEIELQEHVKNRLAAYQMPREIEFVDSLPMTSTGKIRRHVLRAREQQRTARK